MAAGATDAPMAILERQDVLEKLGTARRLLTERQQTPGSAVAGLIALVARYMQVISALVVVGLVLGPFAGVVFGGTAAVIRLGSRGSLSVWSRVMARRGGQHRKMMYVFGMGSDPAGAKEVRGFGLLEWVRDRADAETRAYLDPLWRARRRIYFAPFIGYSAAVLAGSIFVLLQLRSGIMAGTISVLGLSLTIQAILVPLRMGTFFPESDMQTMFGMLAHDTITELEALLPPKTPSATADSAGPHSVTAHSVGRPEEAAGAEGAESALPTVARGVPSEPAAAGRRGGTRRSASGLPRSAVRFEDVRFRYPGSDRDILRGLDLELPAKTSTAIVGVNGAGKTTLVKLLAGLYEPTGGRITVDGEDLRRFETASWQRRLAVIFQDYVRYELDAAANVGLGAPGRLRDEAGIWAAANWAGADGIIGSLPAGLATPLSSRYSGGVDLSGGQWQRIALARASFAVGAGASLLVLDEPTAQLDVRAEAWFFDRFLEITGDLTAVVISHRFSTVRRADRIVVLEDGRIREAGSHDQLVSQGGRYAQMFRLQAQRFASMHDDDAAQEMDAAVPAANREDVR
jgi:ATP-binding cassette subfamily B protein